MKLQGNDTIVATRLFNMLPLLTLSAGGKDGMDGWTDGWDGRDKHQVLLDTLPSLHLHPCLMFLSCFNLDPESLFSTDLCQRSKTSTPPAEHSRPSAEGISQRSLEASSWLQPPRWSHGAACGETRSTHLRVSFQAQLASCGRPELLAGPRTS